MENKREDIKAGAKFRWASEPYDVVTILRVEGDTAWFECDSDSYSSDIKLNEKTGWQNWTPIVEETTDNVVNPAHYTTTKISALEVVNDWELDFYLGNALKYMKRYKLKGNPIQDLEKAVQYLNLKIQLLKDGNIK